MALDIDPNELDEASGVVNRPARRRFKRHRERVFAVLPTMMTLGNAVCGFGAITFAAKLGPVDTMGTETDLHSLWMSAALIFLAMVFDALDGRVARWANQTSEFGAQLDSLCDAVSFGVAPAFLMMQFVRYFETEYKVAIEFHPRLLWVIAALFVICVILRLARFNVETDDDDSHDTFSGLPSPAAAGTVASFPLAFNDLIHIAGTAGAKTQPIAEFLVPLVQLVLPLITFVAACLMVSRIRYHHLFNQWFSGRRSRRHLIQIVFGLAIMFLLREMAVPVLFCYFTFASPLRAMWESRGRLGKSSPDAHTE